MSLFLDNDVVYKLAQMDLLEEAVQALGFTLSSVQVLNTLRFHANSRRIKKRLGEDALKKVITFIDSVNECDTPASTELLIAAEGVKGLDPGELQLLQALLDSPNEKIMITGDKNFLRAFANTSVLYDSVQKLQEKFISFEQIVLCLMGSIGFDRVKRAISNALQVNQSKQPFDMTMRICFGNVDHILEEDVRERLESYISDLRRNTLGLLLQFNTSSRTSYSSDQSSALSVCGSTGYPL